MGIPRMPIKRPKLLQRGARVPLRQVWGGAFWVDRRQIKSWFKLRDLEVQNT